MAFTPNEEALTFLVGCTDSGATGWVSLEFSVLPNS